MTVESKDNKGAEFERQKYVDQHGTEYPGPIPNEVPTCPMTAADLDSIKREIKCTELKKIHLGLLKFFQRLKVGEIGSWEPIYKSSEEAVSLLKENEFYKLAKASEHLHPGFISIWMRTENVVKAILEENIVAKKEPARLPLCMFESKREEVKFHALFDMVKGMMEK